MPEINLNGTILSQPNEIAEAFNHYFVDSVAEISQSFQVDQGRVEPATIVEPAFSLTNITESQVMKTIRSLKP